MTIPKEMLEAATKVLLDRIGSVLNFHGKTVVYTVMSGIEDVAEEAITAALGAQWLPIASGPKDDRKVCSDTLLLAHSEHRWIRFGKWYVQEGCWYYSGTNERSQYAQVRGDEPTHWMPLPPPPTTSDSREK